ncbi:MAG: hypothetical protein HY360_22905 [Verrucomicrobia bacterium]|nr:hypothetical protein [Verrucomicrobiota bacterium]
MLELPNLGVPGSGSFRKTSDRTPAYNCIAWAAGETHRRWWPDQMKTGYWPKGIPRESTLAAFVQAFGTLGYEPCDKPKLEAGFEKVAIYVGEGDKPKHAARQLPNGRWASKLGDEIDIEHDLNGVEGTIYGKAVRFLKRKNEVFG